MGDIGGGTSLLETSTLVLFLEDGQLFFQLKVLLLEDEESWGVGFEDVLRTEGRGVREKVLKSEVFQLGGEVLFVRGEKFEGELSLEVGCIDVFDGFVCRTESIVDE